MYYIQISDAILQTYLNLNIEIIFVDKKTCENISKCAGSKNVKRNLAKLLGHNWFLEIHNTNGDFSYIIEETFRVQKKSKTVKGIEYAGGSVGFYETLEEIDFLQISFVKGEGNFDDLKHMLKN